LIYLELVNELVVWKSKRRMFSEINQLRMKKNELEKEDL